MSDRKSAGQLTTGQKIQQFRDYYMGGALAVLAAAAVIIFMVTRLLSPDQDAAALRIAVFDTELSSEAQEEMAQAVRMSLNLPEDARIVVDTGFVSTNTNEYARLSVLAADGRVDAVIAGRDRDIAAGCFDIPGGVDAVASRCDLQRPGFHIQIAVFYCICGDDAVVTAFRRDPGAADADAVIGPDRVRRRRHRDRTARDDQVVVGGDPVFVLRIHC